MPRLPALLVLASLVWMSLSLACKNRRDLAASNDDSQNTAPSSPSQAAAHIDSYPVPEKVDGSKLTLGLVSANTHLIGQHRAQFIAYRPAAEQDYTAYRICPENGESACRRGETAQPGFVVANLPAGTYRLDMRSCVRSERSTSEACGPSVETILVQSANDDAQLSETVAQYFALVEQIASKAFAVDSRLKEYKTSFASQGLTPPNDDLERAIDNVLRLGAHAHSLAYLSSEFDAARSDLETQVATPQDAVGDSKTGLALTGLVSHEPKSPLAVMMLVGGVGLIGAGLYTLPPFYNPSPVEYRMKRQAELEELGQQRQLSTDELARRAELTSEVRGWQVEVDRMIDDPSLRGTSAGDQAAQKKWNDAIPSQRLRGAAMVLGGLIALAVGLNMNLTATPEQTLRQQLISDLGAVAEELIALKQQLLGVEKQLTAYTNR